MEQDRADVLKRRRKWGESQVDLEPERLIFIDETWASTDMTRRNGRARKGERLRAGIPFGHWKTTTFVAGLRLDGIVAPMVIDAPINGRSFRAYVEKVLVPELRPGDIVVMDNLGSHKAPIIREMIEAAGGSLLYLPPLQPRLQSDRKRLPKAQGNAAQSQRANHRPPLEHNRPDHRHHHPQRSQKLLQCRWI